MKLTSERAAPFHVTQENTNLLATSYCALARELEESGRYAEAVEALGDFWRGAGVRPLVDGLDRPAAADVLLRAGSLTGWVGSLKRLPGAQEQAKNFISEAAAIFEESGEVAKYAEARVSLAVCYWREGALDEARVVLEDVLAKVSGRSPEQEARTLVGMAMVERGRTRYNEALRILQQAAPLVESGESHALKGAFYIQLGTVLENLGRAEANREYTDRALLEYSAASYHFEEAGNPGFCASVENNLGFLFYTLGRYAEAHEHLARAVRLLERVGDAGARVAQVEDTRARVLIAEGKVKEAESSARRAVARLEGVDEQSLLAEALITHGTALARLSESAQAVAVLGRAEEAAAQSGDTERAGVAALTMLEEVGSHLDEADARAAFVRADEMLARTQDLEVSRRLRRCARQLIAARPAEVGAPAAVEFVHASEKTTEMLRAAEAIAHASGPLLVTGETGTGKEALARAIHAWSGRAGLFVAVRCAGLSDESLGARLFGVPAAMADSGAVVTAAGGTLFFDEVAALDLPAQATLLRVIENLQSDFGDAQGRGPARVVASTNADIERLVADGSFRADLFYRLQNFHIRIPPLRERPEDIPALAACFVAQSRVLSEKGVTFTPAALDAMRALQLRGNARELMSLIERTALTAAAGSVITPEMVEAAALKRGGTEDLTDPWENFSLKDEVHHIERRFIELALRDAGGMVSHAAKLLGFKHHESLASLLKSRHRELLPARKPARPRRKSIIGKSGGH